MGPGGPGGSQGVTEGVPAQKQGSRGSQGVPACDRGVPGSGTPCAPCFPKRGSSRNKSPADSAKESAEALWIERLCASGDSASEASATALLKKSKEPSFKEFHFTPSKLKLPLPVFTLSGCQGSPFRLGRARPGCRAAVAAARLRPAVTRARLLLSSPPLRRQPARTSSCPQACTTG